MSEEIKERTEGRVSYHDPVEEMLIRINNDGLSSVFSRCPQQEKIRIKIMKKNRDNKNIISILI